MAEKIVRPILTYADECHHAASATAQEILKKVNAKYVYGVSATPMRSDNLEKINYMLLGPIRHKFTAIDRAVEQGIDHLVIPRYTRVINTSEKKNEIHDFYKLVCSNEIRSTQILEDIKNCVEAGRTPVVLTRFKEHAKYLYEHAKAYADYVYILYGDNPNKENETIRKQLKKIPKDKSLILVATGQKIGEGFDLPRLDTLMLAVPVSYEGVLEQYVGRLNRDYDGKKDVVVYDYIDSHIRVFEKMYLKRLRTYRKIGFRVMANTILDKQEANAIYDHGNYMEVFERDLIESEKEIIVSSAKLVKEKVDRFICIVKSRQEAGVNVTVITDDPDKTSYGEVMFTHVLLNEMREAGITVKIVDEAEHFAVIDGLLVWHGGMNLLGKEDAWDNLIRVKDKKAATELLEMAFGLDSR